jgi:hypothetical protein
MRTILWSNGYSTGAKIMGRPYNFDVSREPNGRADRKDEKMTEKEKAENRSTVMLYRMKVFGLDERDAKDQRAATFIGRLCLAYEAGERVYSLSVPQYHAATDLIRDYHKYQRSMGGPVDFTESRDLWSLSGEPDPVKREQKYEDFCKDSRRRWAEIQKVVQGHIRDARTNDGWGFIRHGILADREVPHLVPAGRELLNLLMGKAKDANRQAA